MKPIGKLISIIVKGGFGLVFIFLVNMLLSSLGLFVGLNIANGVVIGLLGIPGFLLLYALALVDKLL